MYKPLDKLDQLVRAASSYTDDPEVVDFDRYRFARSIVDALARDLELISEEVDRVIQDLESEQRVLYYMTARRDAFKEAAVRVRSYFGPA